ncbi:MAG: AbrB/MazE/SpoVT family DNA-binding domain-containing protein [Clostridia bacterium]|nr:AbrB/MazE/SpoVT family DNA-binding domain-containing protein [Clostridia bacterium]
MKATGIVRRIDDLGRVVIPKEIRRTMRIREGDPLEIYTDREGGVIFKKYSPVGEMPEEAQGWCDTLQKSCGMAAAVFDRDEVIACAGVPKAKTMEQKITPELDALLEKRAFYTAPAGKPGIPLGPEGYSVAALMPIISEGDVIGGVASLTPAPREVGEPESSLIRTAGIYLGRHMES